MNYTIRPAARAPIRRILRFIRAHDDFLCSGHVRSDGDALGSQLALDHLLRAMGKRSHVVCDEGVMPELRFLPGADRVGSSPRHLRGPYQAVFTCDSGALSRLERIVAAVTDGTAVVNIDHHASNERFGTINWIDPSYAATGEMIYDLIRSSGARLTPAMAQCLYVALVTDTGRFSFSNTTIRTHLIAADLMRRGVRPARIHQEVYRNRTPEGLRLYCETLRRMKRRGPVAWVAVTRALMRRCGTEPTDTQEFIDAVKSVKGVRVAVLLRELDRPGRVKVSWRTEPPIDGVALARRFGGGGHRRASGATVDGSLARAERDVIGATLRAIREAR
jgi:phosphoesterase RecJ-like protein